MAKKLNKKVAVIGIILLVLVVGGGMSYLIGPKVARRLGFFQNPDKALAKAQQALEAGDYENAEKEFALAYSYGKTDEYKVERLFDLAEFHLINDDQHEAEWDKVMGCWNKIVSIDPQNLAARRKLLDFYYQAADAGDTRSWEAVEENTTELIDILETQGTQPDTFLLMANAKASLSIAQRGATTDRRTLLDKCIATINQLIESEPQNGELYTLLANAMILQGELNALDGVINAQEKAREKAQAFLETSIDQADDKATAIADLMLYKMQTSQNDPNTLEAIRAEIDQRSKEVQPNDKLWLITSVAYETSGKLSAESEINRAIEAIRQARQLKPDDFEYALRMARLQYRKGNAFNDPASIEDAFQIAVDALSLKEVQDVPGPLQGRNRNYRFALNIFLADFYLEKALAAKESDKETEVLDYTQKAEERIGEIVNTMGSTDNPRVQKYHGFVALAKGQQNEAVQLLYKTYEAEKALDTTDDVLRNVSNVDARVCVVLAEIARQQNQPGLQIELLQAAFKSRDKFILQKPQLVLDYAQLLKRFGAWNAVLQYSQNYQARYGANEESQRLEIEALIAMGQYDKVKELLSSFEGAPSEKLRYEMRMTLNRITRLRQAIASLEDQSKEPTPEQIQELQTLREKRNEQLANTLKDDPKEVNAQNLAVICANMIQNDQAELAVQYMDTFLAATPDDINLRILRLQARQEDPMNLTSEKQMQLREQAINSLTDAKQKAVLLAGLYRSQGEYEKALGVLDDPQLDVNDPDVVLLQFEIALEQKEIQAAEKLLQKIRTENFDHCNGNMAAARLEIVKENYKLALRRLDESLELQPFLSQAYYYKSLVQSQLDDEAGAIESIRTAVRMNPKNASYARQLASLFFARNTALGNKVTVEQQAEAEGAIGMAIRLNPADLQLQGVYSEAIKERDPDRALDIRQNLLKNNPSASNALMLGQMALQMADAEWDAAKKTGLIELAGKAFQQGMEAEPDNEILRQAYADYQQRAGKEGAIELLGGDKNLEWKFYLRNGQFEQAETILKDLLQEKPDDTLLIQGLVLVSQGAGNRDQVKQYLDMLSGLDETKEMQLWTLQKYIDSGFTEEADKKLASFRERFPDEKTGLLLEAWTQMGKGRLDEALALTNRYLETDTNNPGAWRLRGRLYRLMNQPQKAIDDLQHSKDLQDTPAVRMELATMYRESNQATAAIGELASSLEDPQAPMQMRLTLEGLYQASNRVSDLEKLYDSTLEKYPKSAFWYYRVGRHYLMQKNLAKAQELLQRSWGLSLESKQPSVESLEYYLESLFQDQQYDKAMTVASGEIDTPLAQTAYAFMAQIQFQRGQNDKAAESFGKALDKCKNNDTALEGIMGVMLQTIGEDAVTAWISKELAENEKSLKAHVLASSLAQIKGLYNEAIESVSRCAEIVGKESPEWIVYALKKVNLQIMVYVKTGDRMYFDSATGLLSEMLQIQPNNASLMNNLAYLLTDNDQQLETALEYARKAHQGDSGNAVYLDTYAYVQCKTGQYEQAEQNLIRAIQIYEVKRQPVPWDLYEHSGMAKEGLGKPSQAIEMYQKALDTAGGRILDKEKQRLQAAIERLQQM